MAHSSDYSYVYRSEGGNIDLFEIAICLGGNTPPILGNCCASPRVNPWSKIKPVRMTAENLRNNPTWWQGKNGLCGFAADTQAGNWVFQNLSDYVAAVLRGDDLGWHYEQPTGPLESAGLVESDPFRIDDFDGYWRDAESPAGHVLTGGTYVYEVVSQLANIKVSYPEITDTRNLKLLDFGSFTVSGEDFNMPDAYIGVLLYRGTQWVAGTMQTPISALRYDQWEDVPIRGAEAVMSPSAYQRGVKAVMFFSSQPITDADFPDGIGSWNVGDEDLDALIISAFGVGAVDVILHRSGRYDIAFDSDVEHSSTTNLITGDVYLSEASGLWPGQISLTGVQVSVCDAVDVEAFEAGTISGEELLARALNGQTLGNLTFTGSVTRSVSIYCSEDEGYNPNHTYYLVLNAAQLLQPVVSATIINEEPV